MTRHFRQRPTFRAGTTIVETAVVLPVFLMVIFAIFEFGHTQLINNMLNSACRNAARLGAVEGTTSAQLVDHIEQVMAPVIDPALLNIWVNDASAYDSGTPPTSGTDIEGLSPVEVSEAEPREMFVVRARLALNDVAIVPMPFLKDIDLDAQAFMRHE